MRYFDEEENNDHSKWENKGWEHVGWVAVDSGQLIVCDPCYVLPDVGYEPDHYYKELLDAYKPDYSDDFVEFMGEDFGITFGTMHGDGRYPVYVKRKNGQIAQFMVDMDW